ncbi:hypothetical protein [Stenotrophomonas maltophilia]|uniref:hypothetical protein n=1 Tax=Stenotrophomonas maltophilia TaxID=40324 RepID=UPI0012B10B64|nr:hypothetical protein [Stenotrophomonas maltophilia]QGL69123.1 hypothetical protein FEO86_18185 [Stenotrophomonas maltophilia]
MSGMRYRLLPLALVALSFSSFGQTQAFDTQLTRDGVTLNYQDARGALAAPQRKRVIDTFFFAYLRERADFHPPAPAMVRIVIDPAYTGIAFVGDKDQAATITINPGWLAEAEYPGLVLALDKALRDGRYTPALWQKHTGKALPALWTQYAKPRSDAPPPAPARRGKRR